jgi:hypothetical protein
MEAVFPNKIPPSVWTAFKALNTISLIVTVSIFGVSQLYGTKHTKCHVSGKTNMGDDNVWANETLLQPTTAEWEYTNKTGYIRVSNGTTGFNLLNSTTMAVKSDIHAEAITTLTFICFNSLFVIGSLVQMCKAVCKAGKEKVDPLLGTPAGNKAPPPPSLCCGGL